MYSDHTLTPREAVRLCVLGTLAAGPMRYGALSRAVRAFVGALQGPSLDMAGVSLELLRYEGLIEARAGVGMEDDALLALAEAGRMELATLLSAPVRAAPNEHNRLVVALKLRFLHLLPAAEGRRQAALLAEALAAERERLAALRADAANAGHLAAWLALEDEFLDRRIVWLAGIAGPA